MEVLASDIGRQIVEPALTVSAVVYGSVVAVLCIYGIHRAWLVAVWLRTRHRAVAAPSGSSRLPSVTVQLPMFDEAAVADRVIAAACSLDYPDHLLEIQVLDDSVDPRARDVVDRAVSDQIRRGRRVTVLRRSSRDGFKAGALAEGLASAHGELIAIFDADFVPDPDFLLRVVDHFSDREVGMVQARWDHLNRDASLLTRAQAVFLDGHFVIEHAARNRAGHWMNFNGTAGVWRRSAIVEAGGWQHDTLTEDMDLSYRAQLAGWRFVYRPDVTCAAELPPVVPAFKTQQHRWSKGSIETARKLLPTIWRSDAGLGTKAEAFLHMTGPTVSLLVVAMCALYLPAYGALERRWQFGFVASGGLALATVSVASFYVASQRALGRGILATLALLPVLIALGVGISLNNARAVWEAIRGRRSAFVRTPKYRDDARRRSGEPRRVASRFQGLRLAGMGELVLAAYLTGSLALLSSVGGSGISAVFLFLFAAGYAWVGGASLLHVLARDVRPS